MERSLAQLATSYAPGALFTFEGGRGAYICMGKESQPIGQLVSLYASNIIFAQIEEIARNWLDMASRAETTYPIRTQDCIDESLLLHEKCSLKRNQFELVKPENVKFEPMPTVFICEKCNAVASPDSNSCKDTLKLIKQIKKPQYNINGKHSLCGTGSCQWKQLDVVFIHPNGAILPGRPGKYDSFGFRPPRCTCGSKEFMLDKSSPKISQWKYHCADCGLALSESQWRQNEKTIIDYYCSNNPPNTLLTSSQLYHARMFPVPYLSNTVHYPKTGATLDFKDSEFLTPEVLLDKELLKRTLSSLIGIKSSLSQSELLEKASDINIFADEVAAINTAKSTLNLLRSLPASEEIQRNITNNESIINKYIEKFRTHFGGGDVLPPNILAQVESRPNWAQKYDPIRLLFEHEAFTQSVLNAPISSGARRSFVPFNNMQPLVDDDFVSTTNEYDIAKTNQEVSASMQAAGLSQAGLVRQIGVLNYSFGFSRVSPLPTHTRGQGTEPVKLNLFDRIQITGETAHKHPIYVQQSKNEALYFQLDSKMVSNWLTILGATNVPTDSVTLRQYLLEHHKPISTFVDNVESKDGQLQPFLAAYTLLHTFSHQLMHMIGELSGLEISSLGEYLFPLDMAVLIYRNGTTQDLGNFSSLWRNHQSYLFKYLMEHNTLRCSSGELCDNRGGACPGCILIPETSCIASNRLLSRGALSGIGYTKEAGINQFKASYFNFEL